MLMPLYRPSSTAPGNGTGDTAQGGFRHDQFSLRTGGGQGGGFSDAVATDLAKDDFRRIFEPRRLGFQLCR
jgi:hypothetical protein